MEEALAAAASFVVVITSQGVAVQVLLWAFLNWFGLTLEFYLTEKFSKSAYQVTIRMCTCMTFYLEE